MSEREERIDDESREERKYKRESIVKKRDERERRDRAKEKQGWLEYVVKCLDKGVSTKVRGRGGRPGRRTHGLKEFSGSGSALWAKAGLGTDGAQGSVTLSRSRTRGEESSQA
ncbi:unnamed protein product [Boreogadus saida]